MRRDKLLVDANGKDEEACFGLCVWSTGLKANPFTHEMKGAKRDKRGFLTTDGYCRVLKAQDHDPTLFDSIFAIGDCASIDGLPLPATAQVASQKAKWLARYLNGKEETGFAYHHRGSMVYVGSWWV